jgi:hypothetical protein
VPIGGPLAQSTGENHDQSPVDRQVQRAVVDVAAHQRGAGGRQEDSLRQIKWRRRPPLAAPGKTLIIARTPREQYRHDRAPDPTRLPQPHPWLQPSPPSKHPTEES